MSAAVLFDVDGTLIDTNDLHTESWQETFRHFGKEIPYADLRQQVGKGADQYLPVFLSEAELRERGKEIEKFRAELFKTKYLARARPFPRVRELFERVRASGAKTALASSGKEQELAHYRKLAGIDALVDAQTTGDNVEQSKPAPDIFSAALAALPGVRPEKALVVGDSPYDAEAAAKAGIRSIALLCGGFGEAELRAAGALAIYRDPADLLVRFEDSPLAELDDARAVIASQS